MRKSKYIGIAVIAFMLLAASSLSAAATFKKAQFTLRGGFNIFQATGNDSDYIAGENDFPVTPAYQTAGMGIGLAFFKSKTLAIGMNVLYGLSTQVDLSDPSDGETIQADTPKNLVAVLALSKYFDITKQMQAYASLGAGGEFRMADDKEFVSNLGSRIMISAPEKPFSPLAALGAGVQYMFASSLGIAFEVQGLYVFRDPAQLIISPVLALVMKF